MKKQTIELVLPKCPEWFIKLNEEEFPEEIPKIEDFFSPTQLEYFDCIHRSRIEGMKGLYRKISVREISLYSDSSNCEWAENSSSIIFGAINDLDFEEICIDDNGTKIEDEEKEIFDIRHKSISKKIKEVEAKFNEWKLKEQERIHTKWIETFAKLVREP